MARRLRPLLVTVGIIGGLAIAPGAFGDATAPSGVPQGAVVVVGDGPIGRATFEHWLTIAAASGAWHAPGRHAYEPPTFTRCIAHKRTSSKRSHGTKASTLRAACLREYEGLRDQVLQFLILERWVAGEAVERGVSLSDDERERAFQNARKETFPKLADFRRFLKRSGMTEADVRFQTTFNALYTKLREQAIDAVAPVTDADVEAYYAANPDRFTLPRTVDARIVLTKTRARAVAARAALARGQTWHHVARTYSIDAATRRDGGLLEGVAQGSLGRVLDRALFAAPVGRLRGPVKMDLGYYVFEVLRARAAHQESLAQATKVVRGLLTAQRRQAADDAFNADLRAEWRPKTSCRSGFVMDQCANAPADPTASDP